MRSRADHRTDRSLARLARWLGIDRNPLRRGTDRVEGALRLVMIILAVVAVPAAAVAVGRWADHYALHRAQAPAGGQSPGHRRPAGGCPGVRDPDPYTSVQTAWVPARWQPPGQPPRTGEVLALAGARKGSTVRTWIDPSGAVTDPPLDHRVLVGNVWLAVMSDLPGVVGAAAGGRRARPPWARPPAAARLGGRVAGQRPALERSPQLRRRLGRPPISLRACRSGGRVRPRRSPGGGCTWPRVRRGPGHRS